MWFDALVNNENENSLAHHNTERGPELNEGPRRSVRAEFKIKITKPKRKDKRNLVMIPKEPLVRQYLILAYQIKQVLEKEPERTLKDISQWIGYSPTGISTIMRLLFLAPSIQEEILFSTKTNLHKVSLTKIRTITKKLLWKEQVKLWKSLNS